MSDFPTLPKICAPFPVPVLPTVFDESLSYYELLAKLWQQVNELTELVNSETATVNQLIEKVNEILPIIDQLAEITGDVAQIRDDLDTFIQKLWGDDYPNTPAEGIIGFITDEIARLDSLINAGFLDADGANQAAQRNLQLSGLNCLQEVSHESDGTSYGVTREYNSATGWFHITGRYTGENPRYFPLGTYKLRDLYRLFPLDGTAGVTAGQTVPRTFPAFPVYFKAFFKSNIPDDVLQAYSGQAANVFAVTIGSGSGATVIDNINANNIDKSTQIVDVNNYTADSPMQLFVKVPPVGSDDPDFDIWICPSAFPYQKDESGFKAMFPLISNAETPADAIYAEAAARTAADLTLTTEVEKRYKLTLGTNLDGVEHPNLFELPVGVYYRSATVTNCYNLPSDLSVAFIAVVQNTISVARRRLTIYPCTAATAGIMYVCLETGIGYGDYNKFTASSTVSPTPPPATI